jgi:hypothetical protein
MPASGTSQTLSETPVSGFLPKANLTFCTRPSTSGGGSGYETMTDGSTALKVSLASTSLSLQSESNPKTIGNKLRVMTVNTAVDGRILTVPVR